MADRKTQAPEADGHDPVKNTVDLDEISLAQALLDVDVANARVIDLTRRLTTMSKEVRRANAVVKRAKQRNRKLVRQLAEVTAELDEIKRSRAFRSASKAQRVVRAARARTGR
jgi:septal ring factor EnvC (AmiA/AmiB activator)